MQEHRSVAPGARPVGPPAAHCAVEHCRACARDGVPCRFCSGSGVWSPQRPCTDANGAIEWVSTDEDCRMCAGTGREHALPPDTAETRR
ncbi:hypothetical protein [Nocardiopsis coralliicola]